MMLLLQVTRGSDRLLARMLALVVFASPLAAHQPHDEVVDIAFSPTFHEDGIMFIVAAQPPAPHIKMLLRSGDGGLTWQRLVNGISQKGDLTSVAVSPQFSTDRTVLTASELDGVFLSQDGGDTWRSMNVGLPSLSLDQVACGVGQNSELVVLITGMNGGIALTDDLGVTWKILARQWLKVRSIAFSPQFATDGFVIVGDTQGRMYYSHSSGKRWSLGPTLVGAGPIHAMSFANPATGFVGTSGGLYRTIDGGMTFQSIDIPLPTEPIVAVTVSPNFLQSQIVFTATNNQGVFRSTDGGDTWTQLQEGINFDPNPITGEHFETLSVSPDFATDGTVMVGMYEGAFRSTDGGESWFQLETVPLDTVMALELSPAFAYDSTLAIGRYGSGVYLSKDKGNSWMVENQGLQSPIIYDVAFSPEYDVDQTMFALHSTVLALKSTDGAENWTPVGGSLPSRRTTTVRVSPTYAADARVFVGTRQHGLYRSTDGGATWAQVYIPPSEERIDSLALSPAMSVDGTAFAGVQRLGVLRSRDGGTSWTAANSGLPGMPLDAHRGPIVRLSPAFASDRTVFAATLRGLFASTDGGDTWNSLSFQGLPLNVPVEELALSQSYPLDRVLVASLRGIGLFRSSDGGLTWVEIAPSLIESHQVLRGLRFSPSFVSDRTIFAFVNAEILRSEDAGDTWQALERGLVRHEDNIPHDQWISYQGEWQSSFRSDASTASIHWSQGIGDDSRFFFYGTGVRWIGMRASFFGMGDVYLDGALLGTVDLYSEVVEAQAVLMDVSGLSQGLHELKIVTSGMKNPLSTNIGVSVDACDVMR